jgi:hypothetical protein
LKHLVALAVLLTDAFHRLNQTALGTLRELSPQNPLLERPQDFRKAAAQFLISDDESLEPRLRLAGGFPATLLAAIKGEEKSAGRAFVRKYQERFSPTAIEDVVMGEGAGGLFGRSKKERCWDKYSVLAEDFANPALMERWIKDCLGKVVDDYLKRLEEAKVPSGR